MNSQKNLCGTDTWGSLTPCKCRQCQAWLMEYCHELEQDRAGANANSRDQILRIRSLEVKLEQLKEAANEYRERCETPIRKQVLPSKYKEQWNLYDCGECRACKLRIALGGKVHIDIQLDLWIKGVSIHDQEAGGCVPDFSCCHPSLLADFGERVQFVLAFQSKRMDICQGMYLIFLSKLEPKLDVKGFYTC